MHRGYIKLWRALLDKPIWKQSTPTQKSILITLLAMASYRHNEWIFDGKSQKVNPGEFVTSLRSISELSGNGVTVQSVRTALVRFQKLDFLTNKSTNQGRLIKITNWDTYQGDVPQPNKEANKHLTSTEQAPNKHLTPIKKVRREKSKNKEIIYPDFLNRELWDEYKKMRKAIKSPMTEYAETLAINKLKKFVNEGYRQEDILGASIENNWKGLFPPKGITPHKSAPTKDVRPKWMDNPEWKEKIDSIGKRVR